MVVVLINLCFEFLVHFLLNWFNIHSFNLSYSVVVLSGEGNGNYSSTLAWEISWTGEPGRLQSTESQTVGHD